MFLVVTTGESVLLASSRLTRMLLVSCSTQDGWFHIPTGSSPQVLCCLVQHLPGMAARLVIGQSQCAQVSFGFHYCNKMPETTKLERGRFILTHSFGELTCFRPVASGRSVVGVCSEAKPFTGWQGCGRGRGWGPTVLQNHTPSDLRPPPHLYSFLHLPVAPRWAFTHLGLWGAFQVHTLAVGEAAMHKAAAFLQCLPRARLCSAFSGLHPMRLLRTPGGSVIRVFTAQMRS
jgi:hypothetical protein